MALLETAIILLLASIAIGAIGSLLGIGGGVFLIPIMTLGLGIDIKVAAATSLVTIIVTSSTSASSYLSQGIVNVKLGMFLELFTVAGGLIGAFLAAYLDPRFIMVTFGAMLVYTAVYMAFGKRASIAASSGNPGRFSAEYVDKMTNEKTGYDVKGVRKGAGAGCAAGVLSGLIGVGGGVVMVPAMNVWMGVPIKAAAATSNFMIGVTAVASALVYLAGGFMAPLVTAVAAIGIFIGAKLGTRTMHKIENRTLRIIFAITVAAISVLMFMRAGGWM